MKAKLRRRNRKILGWLAVVVVVAIGCMVYFAFNPRDEVNVTIKDLPADTDFVCLIADTAQGPVVLHWYHRKGLPFTMHPDRCGTSYRGATLPFDEPTHKAHAQWFSGSRMGVLRRTKERGWLVDWFKPPKSDLKQRSLFLGGGAWEASIRDADAQEVVTEGQLRELGMDYSLTPKSRD